MKTCQILSTLIINDYNYKNVDIPPITPVFNISTYELFKYRNFRFSITYDIIQSLLLHVEVYNLLIHHKRKNSDVLELPQHSVTMSCESLVQIIYLLFRYNHLVKIPTAIPLKIETSDKVQSNILRSGLFSSVTFMVNFGVLPSEGCYFRHYTKTKGIQS